MPRLGTILCLASGAAFGAMAIFGKLAYGQGTTVATLLVVRFVLAALIFWGLALAAGGTRELRSLRPRDIAVGLGLGAFGYAIQAGCYFAALQRIDASLLALLLYTFPAIVAAAAVAIGRERMDARRLAALALASAGLVLVLAGAKPGAVEPLGAALALTAAFVYSAYILVSDRAITRTSPQLLSALVCTGAAVPLVIGSLLIGQLHLGAVAPEGWLWLVCLTVVSSVAAISFFFAGLRRVGPTTASILATVEPVVTVGLAFLVFGEVLGAGQVLGAALVLSAVPVLHLRHRTRGPAVDAALA